MVCSLMVLVPHLGVLMVLYTLTGCVLAWKAGDAAGVIYTDFEVNFKRAAMRMGCGGWMNHLQSDAVFLVMLFLTITDEHI